MARNSPYRTPRKDKDWADWYPEPNLDVTTAVGAVDVLSSYKTAVGVSDTRNLTVMRSIIRLHVVHAAAASTPRHGRIQVGLSWANVGAAAASLDIFGDGTRDQEWIFRDVINYAESATIVVGQGQPTVPPEANFLLVDSRQMRKQPTPQHFLRFSWQGDSAIETGTTQIEAHGQFLLALP